MSLKMFWHKALPDQVQRCPVQFSIGHGKKELDRNIETLACLVIFSAGDLVAFYLHFSKQKNAQASHPMLRLKRGALVKSETFGWLKHQPIELRLRCGRDFCLETWRISWFSDNFWLHFPIFVTWVYLHKLDAKMVSQHANPRQKDLKSKMTSESRVCEERKVQCWCFWCCRDPLSWNSEFLWMCCDILGSFVKRETISLWDVAWHDTITRCKVKVDAMLASVLEAGSLVAFNITVEQGIPVAPRKRCATWSIRM